MKEEILFEWHKKYFLTALLAQKMLELRNYSVKGVNLAVFSTKSGEFVVFFSGINCDLYHYAGNNPVKYVDPDGRAPFCNGVYDGVYNPDISKTKTIGPQLPLAEIKNNVSTPVGNFYSDMIVSGWTTNWKCWKYRYVHWSAFAFWI